MEDSDEILEPLESMNSSKKSLLQDEFVKEVDDDESTDDESYELKNDPVRKYNFLYDESLCLTNKFPEIFAWHKNIKTIK